MNKRDFKLHDGKSGAALSVRLYTGKGHHGIIGIMEDGTVEIRLEEQANEDTTNRLLISLLAKILKVKPDQVEIVAGKPGGERLIAVMDIDTQLAQERILKSAGKI